MQALVLPKKEAVAFLKLLQTEAADLEELGVVPEAWAAMLCTAKAGLQQRQARPLMQRNPAKLGPAEKLARRLLESEACLLREWQAAAAQALQGGSAGPSCF